MPKLDREKQSSTADTCESCRYYLEYEEIEEEEIESPDDLTGICRRYPPVVYASLTPLSVCPDVARNGWCGEYMPK